MKRLWVCFIAFALMGCGKVFAPNNHQIIPVGQAISGTTSVDEDPGFNCPTENNVVPDYDARMDGSDYYRVCPSKTSLYDVRVHGRANSPVICAIPVQVIDNNNIYIKPGITTGSVLYACANADTSAPVFSFSLVNYNALFIVESPDLQQMKECLITKNYFSCPYYSFGKFRP